MKNFILTICLFMFITGCSILEDRKTFSEEQKMGLAWKEVSESASSLFGRPIEEVISEVYIQNHGFVMTEFNDFGEQVSERHLGTSITRFTEDADNVLQYEWSFWLSDSLFSKTKDIWQKLILYYNQEDSGLLICKSPRKNLKNLFPETRGSIFLGVWQTNRQDFVFPFYPGHKNEGINDYFLKDWMQLDLYLHLVDENGLFVIRSEPFRFTKDPKLHGKTVDFVFNICLQVN